MNNRTNGKQFAIVRFEPNDILLLHKPTKRTYQYIEPVSETILHPSITHPLLLRPIVYNNGLLYPRGISTLETQLQSRKRAHIPIPFQETEIINTFLPLLECLQYLHKNGIIHGGVSPSNIIYTQEEELMIKDWMAECKENIYYESKKRKDILKEDDISALGQIITQATTLQMKTKIFQEKDILNILQSLVEKYSKGLIFAIAVLLKKNKERYGLLHHYFLNQEKYLNDLELNSLYQSIKKQKEKKKHLQVSNQNIIPNQIPTNKIAISLTASPVKKVTPSSSLNNTIKRHKDDQNKKTLHEETKRKQIEKINKIIERSNEFVNELMARKNNQQILKKIAPKPNIAANISMYTELPKKLGKQVNIQISPTKRIRTSSRKK